MVFTKYEYTGCKDCSGVKINSLYLPSILASEDHSTCKRLARKLTVFLSKAFFSCSLTLFHCKSILDSYFTNTIILLLRFNRLKIPSARLMILGKISTFLPPEKCLFYLTWKS